MATDSESRFKQLFSRINENSNIFAGNCQFMAIAIFAGQNVRIK
jgi:hypothetical protein